jgi:hypothetical protein
MSVPAVVLLIVDPSGNLLEVPPLRAEPDSYVMWVIVNEHATDEFKVEVTNFKIKETMAAAMPIGSTHFRRVKAGDPPDTILEKTKRLISFGAGTGLPFTTYKYSVIVTDLTTGTGPVIVDPDLDIPPP